MSDNLLCVQNLSIGIENDKQYLIGVDGINFTMKTGEILGIVGESGCGKSLTALSILGLLPEGISVLEGRIIFDHKDMVSIKKEELRQIRGKELSIIFQEPMTSLNPLMKIGKQIGEVVRLHKRTVTRQEVKKEVLSTLEKVGISEPERCFHAYPHELSGGMRQRIVIAMAIIGKPKLLIADEPTTSLDVTTQAQILNLLVQIHKEFDTSILFISHDLRIVKQFCERALVMYAGKIMEYGTVDRIFKYPAHEYTKGLLNSIPTRNWKGKRLPCIAGKVPNLTKRNVGCPFALRCKKAEEVCFKESAPWIKLGNDHSVCCHFAAKEREKKDGRY
jgi:peptide/nickel transport system ATP-binding protein